MYGRKLQSQKLLRLLHLERIPFFESSEYVRSSWLVQKSEKSYGASELKMAGREKGLLSAPTLFLTIFLEAAFPIFLEPDTG